jgi:predicted ester cyclase
MSTVQNKEIAVRAFDELWNKANLAAADDLYAADYVGHNPASPAPLVGPEGVKMFIGIFHGAFSELSNTVDDVIAEGDRVALRWRTRARHTGQLMNIAPTNTMGEVTGITLERIVDGKIVESWDEWDQVGMLRQMGVMPG